MTSTPSILRRLDPEGDAEALHAVLGDEACCHLMAGPATVSVAETRALLTEWTIGTEETSWAIVEDDAGPALGRVTMIPRGRNVWEAGILVVPAAQGRGLAARALAEAIDIIFKKHGARRIYADTDPENTACIRAFEKLGFQHEGRQRATWETHIGVRDSLFMSLIDTDPKAWR